MTWGSVNFLCFLLFFGLHFQDVVCSDGLKIFTITQHACVGQTFVIIWGGAVPPYCVGVTSMFVFYREPFLSFWPHESDRKKHISNIDVGNSTSFSAFIPENTTDIVFSVTSFGDHQQVSNEIRAETCSTSGSTLGHPRSSLRDGANTPEQTHIPANNSSVRSSSPRPTTPFPTRVTNSGKPGDNETQIPVDLSASQTSVDPSLQTTTLSSIQTANSDNDEPRILSHTSIDHVPRSLILSPIQSTNRGTPGNDEFQTPATIGIILSDINPLLPVPISSLFSSLGLLTSPDFLPSQTDSSSEPIETSSNSEPSLVTPTSGRDNTSTAETNNPGPSKSSSLPFDESMKPNRQERPIGPIIGGGLGGAFVILMFLLVGVCLIRRRRHGGQQWKIPDPFLVVHNFEAEEPGDNAALERHFETGFLGRGRSSGLGASPMTQSPLDVGQSPTREPQSIPTPSQSVIHDDVEQDGEGRDSTSIRAVLPSRTSQSQASDDIEKDGDDAIKEKQKVPQVARIPRARTRLPPPPVVDRNPFSDSNMVTDTIYVPTSSFDYQTIGYISSTNTSDRDRSVAGGDWEVERIGLRAEIEYLRSEYARLERVVNLPPPAYYPL
ncbi:hypothetical protein K435DRAFT_894268 [Dendrothele bispora CBS 962.96]|uniref:Mid2 domain-containing protein n=1 Tax=Dendrothele bispora (strain CBS 962.96) TaxID=1314807 RepID=A0A4S8M2U8_DENBC|nr:hypothetical protein K435DRAFT_894268 [Dendrothele bispora CBS 962.96]